MIGMKVGIDTRLPLRAHSRSRSRSRSRGVEVASEGESESEETKMLRSGRTRSPASTSPMNEEAVASDDLIPPTNVPVDFPVSPNTEEEEEMGSEPDEENENEGSAAEEEEEGEEEEEDGKKSVDFDDSSSDPAAAAAAAVAPEEAGQVSGRMSLTEQKVALRLKLKEREEAKGSSAKGGRTHLGSKLDDPAYRKMVHEKLAQEGPGTPPGDSVMVAEENEDEEEEEKELGLDPTSDMGVVVAGLPGVASPPAQTSLSYHDLETKINALKALGDANIPVQSLPLLLPFQGHGMCLYSGNGCCGSFGNSLFMLRQESPLGVSISGPFCDHCRVRADSARELIDPTAPLQWIQVV